MYNKPLPNCFYSQESNIFNICINQKYEKAKITPNLHYYVLSTKKLIDDKQTEWSKYKKYTNPYEFISKDSSSDSIAKKIPISRAYFKFVDIYNYFNISSYLNNKCIKSFHLAEGPGGFIEALNDMRKNTNDIYYGMTLKPTVKIHNSRRHRNSPTWFKGTSFLNKNKHVKLEYGASGTGDITDIENLKYCMEKYANKFDIVTGDAGFDFSLDYNNQEQNMYELIFTQIIYAIVLQKHNGVFIVKIFDLFDYKSVELLYLLSMFYNNVNVCKPGTSRIANSEKYVVCTNFKYLSTEYLFPIILDATAKVSYCVKQNIDIYSILQKNIKINFLNEIEEINVKLGQQQVENINYTLSLIDNPKRIQIIKELIIKNNKLCKNWCKENNLEYYDV